MIRKVGVIGAGTMGSGIAQKIAQEGFEVVILDVKDEFLKKGMERIKTSLKEAVEKKILKEEQVKAVLERIRTTTREKDCADCDLIIEAVFEDEKVKSDLFQKLNAVCKKDCIFATNTSSLSVSSLGDSSKRPERFVGMHYFYHPAKNRLLEVIGGDKTDPDVLNRVVKFGYLHGKTVIVAKDTPGFVVNRFFVPWLNEATRIVSEGWTNPKTIDSAAKEAFGIGMGPFELMNVTGIPIAYHSAQTLGAKLGSFYAPSDALKIQFEKSKPWDIESGEVEKEKFDLVKRRLFGAVFFVVTQMVDEEVATLADIDRGAKIALRWRKGPFELMNELSFAESYWLVFDIARRYGTEIPKVMNAQYHRHRPWNIEYVELRVEGDIAFITVNRPDAMNALNTTVVAQMKEAFHSAQNNDAVKTIVFQGAGGKAFIAGADIGFFVERIKSNRFSEIYDFTADGHKFLMEIENCPKRVIAALDGVALGGGFETALAAHTIIATKRATMGFPETGIGIYPGLCGIPRTVKRIGKELARHLVLSGEILNAQDAKSIGLVDYICDVSELDSVIREVAQSEEVINKNTPFEKRVSELPERWEFIKSLYSDKNIKDLLDFRLNTSDEATQKILKVLKRKAPIALKLAAQILDEGYGKRIEEASKIELSHLKEVFSTDDALEGLTSVLERRFPAFKGR